jgi:hypothetical protein
MMGMEKIELKCTGCKDCILQSYDTMDNPYCQYLANANKYSEIHAVTPGGNILTGYRLDECPLEKNTITINLIK